VKDFFNMSRVLPRPAVRPVQTAEVTGRTGVGGEAGPLNYPAAGL
jgi:hypothetical protein